MTDSARKADAIVVLGCRIDRRGCPSPALRRRLSVAASAFHMGLAPVVIASGGRCWGDHIEATVMRDTLLTLEIPAERVWLEACSLTTRENAWYVGRCASRAAIRTIVLVTCDFHMSRALASFLTTGLVCIPEPSTTPGGIRRARAIRERFSCLLDGVWLGPSSRALER